MTIYTPEELIGKWSYKDSKKQVRSNIIASPQLGKFQLKIFLNEEKIYDNCSLYHISLLDTIIVLIVLMKMENERSEQEHIFVKQQDSENWIKLW